MNNLIIAAEVVGFQLLIAVSAKCIQFYFKYRKDDR